MYTAAIITNNVCTRPPPSICGVGAVLLVPWATIVDGVLSRLVSLMSADGQMNERSDGRSDVR